MNLEVVRLLLKYGANPNHRMFKRRESVFESSIYKGRIELVKLFLASGAEVNSPPGSFTSPLYEAAKSGDVEIVSELIKHGADVNFQDEEWRTPLIEASDRGHLDVVKLLLKCAADPNARTKRGDTALILAAYRMGWCFDEDTGDTYLEIIKALLRAGAELNVIASNGWSPLDFAEYNPMEGHGQYESTWYSKGAEYLRSIGAKHGRELSRDRRE